MTYFRKAIAFIAITLLPAVGNSQANLALEKGDVLINPSITLGWYDYGYTFDVINVIPPVGLNFEVGAFDYVSLGLEAEFGLRNYADPFFFYTDNEYRYTYKALNIRGSFHYLDLLKNIFEDKIGSLNSEKLDFYVGVYSGILITQSTHKWYNGTANIAGESKTFDSSPNFGYMAGFRYYFSNSFGVFGETGRNTMGWAKLGLTLKL